MPKILYQSIKSALGKNEEFECYACAFELGNDFKAIRNIHPVKGTFKKKTVGRRWGGRTEIYFFPYGKNNSIRKTGRSAFSQKGTFLKCFDYEEESYAEYFSLQQEAIEELKSIKTKIDDSIEEISKM